MAKDRTIKATEETWPDVQDITNGLNNIITRAGDASHLEKILNNATKAIYLTVIPGGAENYSGTSPKLGKVDLVGGPYPGSEGLLNIIFTPSPEYQKKWNSVVKILGKIDLRKNEYNTVWGTRYDENFHHIPKQVMEDTETVMEMMGLTSPVKENANHPF
jgi:hypothetical protein